MKTNSNIHSWPSRSGKTGAAIMKAAELGVPCYTCGAVHSHKRGLVKELTVMSCVGQKTMVIDDYELATKDMRDAISCVPDVHIFGTLGFIYGDYKLPTADKWKKVLESVACGEISMKTALIEYNIVPKAYFDEQAETSDSLS